MLQAADSDDRSKQGKGMEFDANPESPATSGAASAAENADHQPPQYGETVRGGQRVVIFVARNGEDER